MEYIATFHTHFGAMSFERNLKKQGIICQMSPVPRKLSASCGVCVRFKTDSTPKELNGCDLQGIYSIEENSYIKIFENV